MVSQLDQGTPLKMVSPTVLIVLCSICHADTLPCAGSSEASSVVPSRSSSLGVSQTLGVTGGVFPLFP